MTDRPNCPINPNGPIKPNSPTSPDGPHHITVEVPAAPDPFLLRPLIAARLAGRPVPDGPEATVAEAVAAHVRREAGAWR
ncbi:hypothetical protein OG453_40385 [Streptomyces sp. NBC_01381]|uniref:hypothetical protein n=1 Tax=Streptomyces sp. NBC_01381 TaxID=2903845 RepID=UPI002254EA3C|nr:hypothetical protein [Streptomyces sp. NBC_01381]MCX4672830.1 hypothetical protein [Streptomyces sp. NBC_01381]